MGATWQRLLARTRPRGRPCRVVGLMWQYPLELVHVADRVGLMWLVGTRPRQRPLVQMHPHGALVKVQG